MTKTNVLEMSLRIQEVKPRNMWILNSSLGYASQRIHLTVFENTKNKNIKSQMSNKRIYVENLVLLTFNSILRILYLSYGSKLFILFNSTLKVYCSRITLVH